MSDYNPEEIEMCSDEDCQIMTSTDVLHLPEYKYRRTSVIVTLDHLDLTPVDIQQIMESGMNVTRFKMSHAPLGAKIKLLRKIEKAALACCTKYDVVEWPLATCIELRSSLTMTGLLEQRNLDKIHLVEDAEVILTNKEEHYNKCNENVIYIDNHKLDKEIGVGTEISFEGPEVIMKCVEIIDEQSIKCIVTKPGSLKDFSYVCFRGVRYDRSFITNRDLELTKFAVEHNVDMITVNYTMHVDTIKLIKKYMKELNANPRPLILCGICEEQGLENIDELIKVSDGIIFGREFLPYELSVSRVHRIGLIRRWLAAKCHQVGKPFFVSGGVLNKVLRTGDFFLNEIFDVANSIMSGTTGFVLKGCSNTDLVLQAMRIINEVCKTVEPLSNTKKRFWRIVYEMKMPVNAAEACALAAVTIANQSNAHVIIITSVTGDTVRMLLKLRPAAILISVSRNKRVTKILRAFRCTVPLLYTEIQLKMNYQESVEHRVNYAVEFAVKRGWLAYGDMYVTLQKGAELSSYCDTVMVLKCMLSKKQLVICPEDGLGKLKHK